MEINVIIGLVIGIFGLSLILLKNVWRALVGGYAEAHAEYNNFFLRVVHLDKAIKYTGADKRYSASNKGLNIAGTIFLVFGIIIMLLPQIYSLYYSLFS